LLAALALAVTAAMWWIYFSGDDVRAEEAMEQATQRRRAQIAINAFFYATIPMLLGVVTFAAGVKFATAHPLEPIEPAAALALGGGVATYLVGDALFRLSIGAGLAWNRLFAAALTLAMVPIGTIVSAVAELAGIWLVLVLGLIVPAALAERPKRTATAALD
jgi:low temperature requirement protein LtrA